MDSLRELLSKALAEGLVPFMMVQANGTQAKRNGVRLIEFTIMIIAAVATPIYMVSSFVGTQKTIQGTLIEIKKEIVNDRAEHQSMYHDITRIAAQIESHRDYERHGGHYGEEEVQ